MKKNRIILLLVLALVAIAGYLILTDSGSTLKKELKDFAIKDTGSITKIFLAARTGERITLVKTAPGHWMANNKFRAREDAVQTLLTTLHGLRVQSPVSDMALKHVIKDLATVAIKVEVYSGEKRVKTLYVGNATNDGLGTIMMLENSSRPFVLDIPGFDGYLSSRFFTELELWRSKMVFSYQKGSIKSVKIIYPEVPRQSFELSVNGESYTLKSGGSAKLLNCDPALANQYLSHYKAAGVLGYPRTPMQDSILNAGHFAEIEITDINQKVNKVKIYHSPNFPKKEDENGKLYKYHPEIMYALVNDGKNFASVQTFVFGPLLITADKLQK